MKGRRWTAEEDQYLRERVLQSISSGGSQLDAFDEVGKKMGRTAGACGFRWNAVLRQQDPESYSDAKKQRVYTQLQRKRRPRFESLSRIGESLAEVERQWFYKKNHVEQLKKKIQYMDQEIQALENVMRASTETERKSEELTQKELQERYQDLLHLVGEIQQQPAFAKFFSEMKFELPVTDGKSDRGTSS
ncbi:prespore-specific regulator [Thermoactinomyces sp. DSM 45891]|uniref:hypothetical protein n=1 Tax=Thermoactinomyces sp. DSM 45891 TaxID=1761907 RepID=UPI000915F6A8|nr:hypothetical protein [Thermoactinomyces sp. DSM 45891]SFX44275.1 prespore-specific regulator [Thermoactinomyces sp. DSM 45891]